MELYPLRFIPIYKERIWGGSTIASTFNRPIKNNNPIGESWEISAVQNNISVVQNGFLEGNTLQELIEIYMGDLVGESVYETFGVEFPLLIKYLDSQANLSIQVHPHDDLAKQRHKAYGKTEMWYVLDADKDAELIIGFSEPTTKKKFMQAVHNGTLLSKLNTIAVQKHEAYFIPSGTIHAIGKGVLIAEIQQTSDITYRIYDYDRVDEQGNARELHVDLALDAINYDDSDAGKIDFANPTNSTSEIVACPYFTTQVIHCATELTKDYVALDSFVVYMCIEGEAEIYCDSHEMEILKQGETLLIPATCSEVRIKSTQEVKLLEVYIDNDRN